MLEHCSDLKRQLVEFARSRRFSRQFDQALSAGSRGKAVDESEFINIIDHFILQRPLPGGRTVVEAYVLAHPELAEADRQMLLGWRDVVEGVFEIRERDGEALLRKHKPWCFEANPLPPVTPLSSELAEALPSSE